MKIISHNDGTYSLNGTKEDIRRLICLSSYVIGWKSITDMDDKLQHDNSFFSENCYDVLDCKIGYVNIENDGKLVVLPEFEVVDV